MSSNNNRSDFFNKVIRSLNSIADPNQFNKLSNIEIDLIMEKLRQLYDEISGIPEIVAEPEKKVELENLKENEITLTVVDEKIQQSQRDLSKIESEELISSKIEKKKKKDKPDKETNEPDLFFIPDKNPKEPEPQTVVDLISEDIQKESVADKIQNQSRVESLKNAIGINEKFFFINELFDGNLNEYNEAIESLNKMNSMDESVSFLENLSNKYNWQSNADAVEQLKQFVERKLK